MPLRVENCNMKLSIIIPMYNVENYIDQCIRSILSQNIPTKDYEVIIIDDGSSDNSYNIVKGFSNENLNINLYFQKNQGVSIARNKGIKYAKGKYLYFLDADDYLAQDSLNHLIDITISNNLDVMEFSYVRTKSRDLVHSKTLNDSKMKLSVIEGEKYISTKYFNDAIWVYFYNREFLLNSKIIFYENRTKQDMLFNAELIQRAKRISYYPMDVYRWVINDNSITTRRDPIGIRRSINDFVFITIEYNELILKFKKMGINTLVLTSKQQTQLFNIFKLILQSNLKLSEISDILKTLKSKNLYPSLYYNGKNFYRKFLIQIFNLEILFYFFLGLYRIFNVLIKKIVIKRYQNENEKKVNSSFK